MSDAIPTNAARTTGTLSLDIGQNRLSIKDLRTPDYTIDSLEVNLPGTDDALTQALSLKSLMKGNGSVALPDLNQFAQAPLDVQSLQMHIPNQAAGQAMAITQGDALKAQGISDVGVAFHPGNQISLSGRVCRGLTGGLSIPFEVKGQIGRGDDTHARVSVTGMHVAGIIPVPGLLQSIVMAMGDAEINSSEVQREGRSYLMNLASFMPPNLHMKLDGVSTEEGSMVVTAGQPNPSQAD